MPVRGACRMRALRAMRMLPRWRRWRFQNITHTAFSQLLTGFAPANPLPVGNIAGGGELAAALETNDQVGKALRIQQFEIGHELAANFAEHRDIAAHRWQAALHGFHQRQAKAFDE